MRFLTRAMKMALLLSGLLLGAIQPAKAETVFIQSVQNGKFAGFYNDYLAARYNLAHAQPFDLVMLANGRVAFQDPANGRYLRAGAAGAELNLLEWGDHRLDEWEMFDKMVANGHTVLRSVANRKYVRAGIGQQTYFGAVSDHTLGWEQFRLVRPQAGGVDDSAWLRDLIVGSWRIDEVMDQTFRAVSVNRRTMQVTRFIIQRDGRFTFTAGCNMLSGRINIVRPNTGEVRVSDIMTERLACNNEADRLERTVSELLEDIRYARRLDANRIVLDYSNADRRQYGFILRRR